LALLILVYKFEKDDGRGRKKIFNLYLKNTKYINNWDLVDLTAPKIIGAYLVNGSRKILYKLARSDSVWERRIAILATYAFIKAGEFKDTLAISRVLLNDAHDLIHKAVGWMLREVGKRSRAVEDQFLKRHHKTMPRTMLRYAIERFPERLQRAYLVR
ncbi:MAG: DNA alkylation repair protein, partial [Candidatus Sungbacteria bacterium]|nr:DNA alkylation repair protein [Candidatus Sungbacteria bacterium]